jgi:uncharacterized membrane protein YfcA
VQWRELRHLLPGLVVGTVLGLWLLPHLQARWPLLLLGLYVAAVGVNALRPAAQRTGLPAPIWAYPVGTAIGLVEMLFGTAGPLVVAWLSRRVADVKQMRASTPMIITVAASTVLAKAFARLEAVIGAPGDAAVSNAATLSGKAAATGLPGCWK